LNSFQIVIDSADLSASLDLNNNFLGQNTLWESLPNPSNKLFGKPQENKPKNKGREL